MAKHLELCSTGGRLHHFTGYGVTDKEVVAIVESLAPIE
jgi:hypothetical protein